MEGGTARLSVSILLATGAHLLHRLDDGVCDWTPKASGHRESHHSFALRNWVKNAHSEPYPQRADLTEETFLDLPPADKTSRQNTDDLEMWMLVLCGRKVLEHVLQCDYTLKFSQYWNDQRVGAPDSWN